MQFKTGRTKLVARDFSGCQLVCVPSRLCDLSEFFSLQSEVPRGKVRGADGGIKPGVSAANPGNRRNNSSSPRSGRLALTLRSSNSISFYTQILFVTDRRPLRGLNALWLRLPGVRCAHPGLYAAVRSADFYFAFINSSGISSGSLRIFSQPELSARILRRQVVTQLRAKRSLKVHG